MSDIKLPIGDTLSSTFEVFAENAGPLITTAAIVWVVPALLTAAIVTSNNLGAAIVGALVLIAISIVASVLLTGAIVSGVTSARRGGTMPSARTMLEAARPLIAPIFVVSLLTGLACLAGLIVLIPGIVFAIWFSLSPVVVVNEGLTGTDAMKRSKAIVSGNGFRLFVLFIVFVVIAIIASNIVVHLIAAILPGVFLPTFVGQLASHALIGSLQAVALVLVYLHLVDDATATVLPPAMEAATMAPEGSVAPPSAPHSPYDPIQPG